MTEETYPLREPLGAAEEPGRPSSPRRSWRLGVWFSSAGVLGTLGAHALLCLACQGGWAGIRSPWPTPWHDHPMHIHNAWVSRAFFQQSGTTAGYDPYFMAGYAKSIVSDPSGTMIETLLALVPKEQFPFGYKLLLLVVMAGVPILVGGAILGAGGRSRSVAAGVLLFLAYLWTDFPLEYAGFGMFAFFLVVPLAALVVVVAAAYSSRGGLGRWLLTALVSSLLMFVHPLGLLTAGPAAVAAHLQATWAHWNTERSILWSRHLGALLIPVVMAAANAVWYAPALILVSTSASEGFGFYHPEPVIARLGQIVGFADPIQGPIQVVLLAGGLVGLAALGARDRTLAVGLGAFMACGFFWGYLAGAFRAFDFLEPGRNTYAVYTGAAIASGIGWAAVTARLAKAPGRLDRWATLGALLVGLRLFGPSAVDSIRYRTGIDPIRVEWGSEGGFGPRFARLGRPAYLSSQPTSELRWFVDRLTTHFEPGDRIYYEEGGRVESGEGPPDIFQGRRYGGLLPMLTGLEVIGGPFLNIPVHTNQTQFGMGRMFGLEDWGREEFDRYGEIYRPAGIVCWTEQSKAFCRANPDRIEVLEEQGPFLIGRVIGFEGDAIRGEAEVEASAGRLVVRVRAADVDGPAVLRYHSVPGLRSRPPLPLREVQLPGDPVPFLGVPETTEPIVIEWAQWP